ncbi:hypothetical protein ABIA18_000641 [Sinorhizobium fredii]
MPGGQFDGYVGLSRSVSEDPDKGTKGRRQLAAAGIVEMIAFLDLGSRPEEGGGRRQCRVALRKLAMGELLF